MATDWSLVERVRAGDPSAFDEIIARYKRPILAFVYRMIGDATEAEDVAQDVFVRAYGVLSNSRFMASKAAFSTWLFQVARNAAIDCLRRRKRRPSESLDACIERGGFPDRSPNPRDVSASREVGERIAAAIGLLPEDQRAVLVLSEYDGLSDAEIASVMQCSVKSVESRLYRARRFLRERLADLLQ